MLLLAALAAWVRARHWAEVCTPDGVLLLDGDSYYHAWRVLYSVENFPAVLTADPFMNFPHGGDVPWPPGFDWLLAAFVRVLIGSGDPAGAERLLAWSPVVLGACTVPLAMAIAYRLSNGAGACMAGLGVALLPAACEYTQIGHADHHAAVFLLDTALLGGALRVVSDPGSGPRWWPLLAAALTAAGLLVWVGTLLQALVLQGALLVWLGAAATPALARERALRLALAHGGTAALLWPFCYGEGQAGYGNFTPLALSNFQLAWFGAGALCFVAVHQLWRAPRLGATRWHRVLSGAGAGVLGIALAFALAPGLPDALARGVGWFSGDLPLQERIGELAPLLGDGGESGWLIGRMYSGLGYLLPLAWIGVWVRRPRALDRKVLVAWSVVFTLATLHQYRFINTSSVAFSLVWGVALGDAIALVRNRLASRRRSPWIAIALSGLALLALSYPTWRYYRPEPGTDALSSVVDLTTRSRDAARYLGQTERVARNAAGVPEFGVMSSWGIGHLVRYYAGLPVVQDNFGPYVAPENAKAASRYYAAADESEAVSILDELRVRYVLADWQGAGGAAPYPPSTLTQRMVRFRGSDVDLRTKDGIRHIAGLTRHRLLYETGSGDRRMQVWERVAGATVVGRAQPGEWVRASLVLDARPFRHHYEVSARADDSGTYTLRLPYSTAPSDGFLRPAGRYRIRSGARSAELDVAEEDVLSGTTVPGPPLD